MVQAVKGTKDLFGLEMNVWENMEKTIKEVCKTFSISQIRTPVFEHTELFIKSTGETTDIVQKEMYTFTSKGDKSITLKPEVTASVVRSFIEHKMYANSTLHKFFYFSPCFRYEKPQLGRYRQFHQFGVEYFGSYEPYCDAEIISIAHNVLKALNIKTTLYINSLGDNECRKNYNETLKAFLIDNKESLCDTCKDRLEKNPLRVLDCKEKSCQKVLENAPDTISLLGSECRKHFDTTLSLLEKLNIDYTINTKMVRGLDYYTKTVFEFVSDDIGAQGSVCGGGRYDNLMEQSGGPKMAGIGFAMGLERLLLCLLQQDNSEIIERPDLFIGAMGERGLIEAQILANDLRKQGAKIEAEFSQRGVKAQMKYANKINAKYSLILGEDELNTKNVKLKNMESGEEIFVTFDKIKENLK